MIRIVGTKLAWLILLILTVQSTRVTRITSPVTWKWEIQSEASNLILQFTATMQKNWHIYSQYLADGGPIATSFHFTESKSYKLEGAVLEPKPIVYFDKNFEMEVKYFSNEAIFKQKIKRNTKEEFTVEGYLTFMCCDDSKCLPPEDVPFKLIVNKEKN